MEPMTTDGPWTVGQLAELTGVTVRTLHHYDDIGILTPQMRSAAGYRLYSAADLEHLQQIVVYRRLEMPLDQIAALLASPASAVEQLQRQRTAVMSRRDELTALADAIDRALERTMNQQPATEADLRDLFGESYREEYQTEAQDRWGESDPWRQSAARTKTYTKADWAEIKAETDAINADFIAALRAGESAGGEVAMAVAERARQQIDQRFYPCSHEFHANLGEMYVSDQRFTASYDRQEPGLAQYVRNAIVANSERTPASG